MCSSSSHGQSAYLTRIGRPRFEAGLELGTGASSVPRKLGSANFDLGIIAGTRSVNLILSGMISGPDDGKVSVENTRLEGMHHHLEMQVTHTFMMRNSKVIEQVIHYLETGSFAPLSPGA